MNGLDSISKTSNSKFTLDKKHIKHRKTKKQFQKLIEQKCRLRSTRISKNNDHTRIMNNA